MVHPVPDLREDDVGPLAEHDNRQGWDGKEQQRQADEREDLPPRIVVTRDVQAGRRRACDIGGEDAQQREPEQKRELRRRRLQLAHPFRRLARVAREIDAHDQEQQQRQHHPVDDAVGRARVGSGSALRSLGHEIGDRDDCGDRERCSRDVRERGPGPALNRGQKERADDLRPRDHDEGQRQDLREAHCASIPVYLRGDITRNR